MNEKPTRRRRRTLLVPLLGIGVAAWAVRSRLAERGTLHDGWQPLPPRRVTPDRTVELVAEPEPIVEPEPVARLKLALPEPAASEPEPAATPEPEPAEAAPEPVAAPEPEPEPVHARARAVPAAAAVASVTAPALPDAPFGPGSAPALDDGASPDPDYVVKGKTATRVFYAPGSAYYARTRADVWFRTPDDASAAGFTARAPRRSGEATGRG
jgi:hypothetical protein